MGNPNLEIITTSYKHTIALGKKVGALLSAGDTVALIGELGSGKTTFTKGIARALGLQYTKEINSPSFVLIKEYDLKLPLYHVDVYRLKNPLELECVGFEEYISERGVLVIEWADKVVSLLPRHYLTIKFEHLAKDTRLLKFIPNGKRYNDMIKDLSI
ncbi:MAG: tRNA (adenosine(37)-N6)-threonylcarbamoyltransferase complex ATPase subunit type 1 TsaE [Candidatus Omnitrophota bacterium]